MKTINLKIEVEEEGNSAHASLIIDGKVVEENSTRGRMGCDTASHAVAELLGNFYHNLYRLGFELNFEDE